MLRNAGAAKIHDKVFNANDQTMLKTVVDAKSGIRVGK